MATPAALLAIFSATVANAAVYATLGLFARGAGLAELQIGAIFTISGGLFCVTSAAWGRVADRDGPRAVVVVGLLATAAPVLLFAVVFAGPTLPAWAVSWDRRLRRSSCPSGSACRCSRPAGSRRSPWSRPRGICRPVGRWCPCSGSISVSRLCSRPRRCSSRTLLHLDRIPTAPPAGLVSGGVRRRGRPAAGLLSLGAPLCATGFLVAATMAADLATVTIAFAVVGAGYGTAQPGLVAATLQGLGDTGPAEAVGHLQAAASAAWIVGPMLGTAHYAFDCRAPRLLAAATLLAVAIPRPARARRPPG